MQIEQAGKKMYAHSSRNFSYGPSTFISKWKMDGNREDIFHEIMGYLGAWVHPSVKALSSVDLRPHV